MNKCELGNGAALVCCIASLWLIACGTAFANPRTDERAVWVDLAGGSTRLFGGLTKREAASRALMLTALRYGRLLRANDRLAIEYTADLIPLAVTWSDWVRRDSEDSSSVRRTVPGIGLAPVGFRFLLGRGDVRPFAAVSGGMIWFKEAVPLPQGTRFVFTGDVDSGIQIRRSGTRALMLGIKFHHISNGGRRDMNRGHNRFGLFAGVSAF